MHFNPAFTDRRLRRRLPRVHPQPLVDDVHSIARRRGVDVIVLARTFENVRGEYAENPDAPLERLRLEIRDAPPQEEPQRRGFLRGARAGREGIVAPTRVGRIVVVVVRAAHLGFVSRSRRHLLDERGDGVDAAEGRDGVVQEVRERLAGVRVRVGVRRHRVFVVFVFVVVVVGMAVGLADQDGVSPEGSAKGAEVRLAEAVGARRLAHEDGREPPRVRGAQHARPEAVARRRVHRATRRAIQPRRLLGGDAQALGGSLVARVRVDEVPRERAERHAMRRRRVHLRHGANAVRACRRGPPPIVAGARAALLSWFLVGLSDGFLNGQLGY